MQSAGQLTSSIVPLPSWNIDTPHSTRTTKKRGKLINYMHTLYTSSRGWEHRAAGQRTLSNLQGTKSVSMWTA